MDVLLYVGKSAGILSIFYLVYYFVLRKDTFFTANRHFLSSGILAAILLPFLQFTQVRYVEAPSRILTETMGQPHVGELLPQHIATGFTLDWWQVLLFIYTMGCFIMGIQLLVQLFSLLKLLRKYPSNQNGAYKFVAVDEHFSPFSFFKYIVYNPALHSEKEIAMILAHEKVHAKQWHSVDILLINVIRIVQWINPVSWLYKKSLEENLEFIADDQTVQIISCKKEYQLALVRASSTLIAPALTVQFYQSFIKKRIIMLNKRNSNKYNQLKLSLIIPFLALFLWSFNVTEVIEYTDSEPLSETKILSPELIRATPDAISATSEDTRDNALNLIAKKVVDNPKERELTQTITQKPAAVVASAFAGKAEPTSNITAESSLPIREVAIVKDYRFTVTSKTTDAELTQFKNELKKDHGLNMTYSVERDQNGEIISLSFSYTGKGNNGSFNINDDTPIEDFYFYIQENGDTGFWSGNHTVHHQERMLKRSKEMEERHEKMTERMEEHLEKREIEMEKRQKEMEERQVEMEERRSEMGRSMEKQKERLIEAKHSMQEAHETDVYHNSQSSTRTTHSDSDNHSSHSIILDSDTSDATLANMKRNLKKQGVSFSYSKLKRNSAGKITRIRVEVDNNQGSKQSIFSKTDDGEPIDEMLIEFE